MKIPKGKWYQEATIKGEKMPTRREKDTSEGRWKKFVEPLIPFKKGEGRLVTDLGCNAGFYSRKMVDRGFRALGVEKDPVYIAHGKYWEENDPKGVKILHEDINKHDLFSSHIVLMANIHYWLSPKEFERLVKKLRARALYVILIGRYHPIGNHRSTCTHKGLKEAFKGWEEVGMVPGKKHFSVIFKNPDLVEKDVEEFIFTQPLMKSKKFMPSFNKLIDTVMFKKKFDPQGTDYYEYLKWRGWKHKDRLIKKHIALIKNVMEGGIKNPLVIGRMVKGEYDENRLTDGDHRLILAKKLGIKKLLCVVKEHPGSLSVVIPSRNEEFLQRTIDDILENAEGETDIIVALDGAWPKIPIKNNPRVVVLFFPESIGQRAATNQAVRLSKAKYIMKVDAHCAFSKGFDIKMMDKMKDDWTMIPVMRNLHAFNWVCPKGHTRYQGPSGPCKDCGKETKKDVVWIPKTNPQSTAYRFDNDMHFQYWGQYKKKQKNTLSETLSIQGSCFMVTRKKWWELDICSEEFNSWGQQGVEVACKTWLSGGRVIVNKSAWYAHMFRTQGGDFSFPYKQHQSKVNENREISKKMFMGDNWPGAKHKFSWLMDKFNPPGWTRGLVYYTDNRLADKIIKPCQKQLKKVAHGKKIVSASLKPIDFGENIVLDAKRGYLTMYKQILAGLDAVKTDIVFLCEHDILYHPDHFDFIPPKKDVFYYQSNYWFLRYKDGHAIHYDVSPLSSLCAFREPLMKHFEERIQMIEKDGFSYKMGFEPMTHGRIKWKNKYDFEVRKAESPNVDICHGKNLTQKRWSKDKFRRAPKGWQEADIMSIPGWDNVHKLLDWPACLKK